MRVSQHLRKDLEDDQLTYYKALVTQHMILVHEQTDRSVEKNGQSIKKPQYNSEMQNGVKTPFQISRGKMDFSLSSIKTTR